MGHHRVDEPVTRQHTPAAVLGRHGDIETPGRREDLFAPRQPAKRIGGRPPAGAENPRGVIQRELVTAERQEMIWQIAGPNRHRPILALNRILCGFGSKPYQAL